LTSELTIYTDSQYVINSLTKNLRKNEDSGWVGVSNKELLLPTVAWLRSRTAKTCFIKVKGHSGDIGNDGADRAAGEGAEKPSATLLNLLVPGPLKTHGMRLSTVTHLVYKGIISMHEQKER